MKIKQISLTFFLQHELTLTNWENKSRKEKTYLEEYKAVKLLLPRVRQLELAVVYLFKV